MTIVNVLIHDDYAILITDTKATSAFGPDFHVCKVKEMPHMRIAVATRGAINSLEKISIAIAQHAANYEQAKAFLDLCFAGLDLGEVDVFVAGYDGDKPAAFMISSVNSGGRCVDIPYITTSPVVPDAEFDRFANDPIGGMLELCKDQCRADPRCGGWINVTQVGPAVIESYTAGICLPGASM